MASLSVAPETGRHPVLRRRRALADAASGLLHVGERMFVVFAVWAFTGGLAGVLLRGPTAIEGAAGDKVRIATLLPIFLFSITMLSVRWNRSARVVFRNPSVVLLLIMAMSSFIWSDEPRLSLWRACILFGTTCFGFYLAVRFSIHELLRLLAFAFGVIAILSLLFVLYLPAHGISTLHPGAWQGIYGHKNALGLYAALGAIVFALVALDTGRARWAAVPGALLCSVLVLGSRSSTGLVLISAVLAILPVAKTIRDHRSFALPLAIVVVVLLGGFAVWTFDNEATVLGWVGREPTLSGRTALWSVLLEAFRQRPWLGYGYSAFWVGWGGESSAVWSAVGWDPWHAHNGFLDVALQLGAIGLLILLAGFTLAAVQALRTLLRTDSEAGIWPPAFLVFVLLSNLTESSLLKNDSLLWALYVTTVSAILLRSPRRDDKAQCARAAGRLSPAARHRLRRDRRREP